MDIAFIGISINNVSSSLDDVNYKQQQQLSLEETVDFSRPVGWNENNEFLNSFDFRDIMRLLAERKGDGNDSAAFGGFNLAALLNRTGSGRPKYKYI